MKPAFDQNHKHFIPDARKVLKYDCSRLQHWLLHTPIGREILRKERAFFARNVGQLFGNYSLQIGLSDINLLQGNKILNHYTINIDLQADLRFLPLASDSIDLIVCPHVLEFTNNYHHVLQEIYRVLAPHGKLILTCFNQSSWFGLCQNRMPLLRSAQLIKLSQLKNQLETLNFNLDGGKFFSYCPPLNNARQLRRLRFFNQIGDRWFPTLANSFAIIARKEIITHNIIKVNQLDAFEQLNPNLGAVHACHKN